MIPKFDFLAYAGSKQLGSEAFKTFVEWTNAQIKKLGEKLRGPVSFDAGSAATTKTLVLTQAHLTLLTLTGNVAITLSTAAVRGDEAKLELLQDAVGGRVPTWVNATGTGSAVTAPAVGIAKKTLYLCTFGGTNWILTVLASNYS